MQSSDSDVYVLAAGRVSLWIEAKIGEPPSILHWGRALSETTADQLRALCQRQWIFGGPSVDIMPTLMNAPGHGHLGALGFLAHRGGTNWTSFFRTCSVQAPDAHSLEVMCRDENTRIATTHKFRLSAGGVLSVQTFVKNEGQDELTLDWCAPAVIPVPSYLNRIRSFSGRWAGEFQSNDTDLKNETFLRENRTGRTGHNGFPGFILLEPTTTETQGEAVAFHLAWSGNNRLSVHSENDSRRFAQLGELFHPGEMVLKNNEKYQTPELICAWTADGLSALSQQLHRYVRGDVLGKRSRMKPRPVHFNTWEAVYFDHSTEKLMALADQAASVGAERFVLDDGWFGARRDDSAGLGDWFVSKDVYPDGLGPISEHVRSLGMEFGLWFEPEMVNRESDLFRQHPEWVLGAPGVDQIPSRNQYALNLCRDDVAEYLFGSMSELISAYEISYIKWDMNRDLQHPCDASGRGVVHDYQIALYELIQRLRDKFEGLEIESCASGGGRADYAILRYTDRIWLSDNNDALERLAIQEGASFFFPPEVLGSHVGPKKCHTTGRVLDMHHRVGTALFAHMGIECDLSDESSEDISTLRNGTTLYKEFRSLIHSGDHWRLSAPQGHTAFATVARDQSRALVSCVKVGSHQATLPARLRLVGIDPYRLYSLRMIWPPFCPTPTSPSPVDAMKLQSGGIQLPGEALVYVGFQLPWVLPNTSTIFLLEEFVHTETSHKHQKNIE